ncbi:MAG: glycosyltransferase [Gammaproteobacteria bacterium]|nr:glycosyltransferase [Gammaproteobacteria bacterium]MCP5135979.1 glycosyltransferase [Gammaproteobacteria bacterium]
MKISFTIAVYNNSGSILPTYERIRDVFTAQLPDHEFEILFVNDGSKDDSFAEIKLVSAQDVRVKYLSFTRNFGQMSAMLAGFEHATGDAVINVSADLQDPISLVPTMVERWKEGAEIVICYRESRSDSFQAKLFSRLAYGVLRMSHPEIPPGGFDYVLIDRKAMDEFNSIDVRHRYFQGDLLWTGYKSVFIPYEREARRVGRSQYNFGKKLKNFLDAVLDASYLPIRFISLLGVVTSALGVLYSITVVISWLYGGTPFEGWAPLMVVVLIIGGILMLMLGIIGEYIWRINEEVRKRPNYVVREKQL